MMRHRTTGRAGGRPVHLLAASAIVAGASAGAQPVPTTLQDFFIAGTQPTMLEDEMRPVTRCDSCHGGYDFANEPTRPWVGSMMGQAVRDPLYLATLAVAELDADFVGDLCIRCHAPAGWLEGRSTPTDGSALIATDLEGVTCHTCHRMVDPVYKPGESPSVDADIINVLTDPPATPNSGSYVIDPLDRRRGPFDLESFNSHEWLLSPFHAKSEMCATCHDVSNPVYTRNGDIYELNDLNTPHLTQDKYEMFPVERTYSEWAVSAFALGPIEMGGRFGGNKTAVSTCQDCHMPDVTGRGASRNSRPIRDDLADHHFSGGNSWVLNAIRSLNTDEETLLNDAIVDDALAPTTALLQAAADLDVEQEGSMLEVTVTNWSGHKLPTGYPEGRRMWINVRFLDAEGLSVREHGNYENATLTTADTKVYEAKLGVDQAISDATGVPVGESFHFALNNVWIKDNRIPPLGFDNAAFEQVQAAPVGYTYEDGQHWDETYYDVPPGAVTAEVRLLYQTSSREYIEFLRDTLDDGTGTTAGDILHAQWVAHGMGAPVEMGFVTMALTPSCAADLNGDGIADVFDLLTYLGDWFELEPGAERTGDMPASIDVFDLLAFLEVWFVGC